MAVWLIAYPAYRPAMSQPRRQGSLPRRPAQRRTIACAVVAARWDTPARRQLSSTGEVARKDEYPATQARSLRPS